MRHSARSWTSNPYWKRRRNGISQIIHYPRSKKNLSYPKILRYCLLQHTAEHTNPLLGENGLPLMREEFFLDGILTEPFSFAVESEELNREYELYRNPRRLRPEDSVALHHFVLVFNSTSEQGMTGEKAHRVAMKLARRCFPGYKVLVCTHTDTFAAGEGQCHTHLYVNNRRYKEMGPDITGRNTPPGMKLQTSRPMVRDMEKIMLEICHEEGLLHEKLPAPTQDRVSSKEYMARKKGQMALDRQNRRILAEGGIPWEETFKTGKGAMRVLILEAAAASKSEEELRLELERRGIRIDEKDGRWRYSRPDGRGFVSAHKLGDIYQKEALLRNLGVPRTAEDLPAIEKPESYPDFHHEEREKELSAPSRNRHHDLER